MITTGVIAFREFLEAFLIVGVFLGISRKMKLKKELEISLAAGLGLFISLLMSIGTYMLGDRAHMILTEDRAEILEGYLLIFSGLFIAYVVFSLHDVIRHNRGSSLIKAHQKLQENAFDMSLFFTIIFLVLREGFEIALFTASTALFAEFMQNLTGLLIGFFSATIIGLMTFFAYIRFPIGKVFKATEYMIILLGASLVQNGVNEMLEHQFNIKLEQIIAIPLKFLPDKHSPLGHLIQSFFGIDRDFSLARLAIMAVYVLLIYMLFFRRKKTSFAQKKTL
jgi:FTR1 family protein